MSSTQLTKLPHQQLDVVEALDMMIENNSGSGSQLQIGSSVLCSIKWGQYIKQKIICLQLSFQFEHACKGS
jgi:hypothetical protein